MEQHPKIKRPKRIWVAVGINSIIALLALGFLAYMSLGTRVPDEVRPNIAFLMRSSGLAILLLAASATTLVASGKWRYTILIAASIYFGAVIYQNMALIISSYSSFETKFKIKLIANVVHNSAYLAINFWAILSKKTKLYFESKNENS